MTDSTEQTLVERLRTRAQIRRGISTRKSVQNGEIDRLSNLLEEAADKIADLEEQVGTLTCDVNYLRDGIEYRNKQLTKNYKYFIEFH